MSSNARAGSVITFALVAAGCIAAGVFAGYAIADLTPSADSPATSTFEIRPRDGHAGPAQADGVVIVYTQARCAASEQARQWLASSGVAYEERSIQEGNAAWTEAKSLGIRVTPAIVTASAVGEGFDPKGARELIDGNDGTDG